MRIQILISAIIILAFNIIAEKGPLPNELFIEVDFYPSFHLPIKLKLYKSGEVGYLTFTAVDKKDKDKIISRDSVQLSKNDFINFFKKMDKVSLLKIPYDTLNIGTDGITLMAKILQDGQEYQFRCWSPRRNNFLDAIFELLNNKLPKQENYIEDIQAYFNYGLPVKIKSIDPFIARIYGGISIDFDSELQKFLKKVPKRKKAILDMRNFGGMGTVFADDFEEFDLSHPKVIWVIPLKRRDYFKQFGLDTTKMVENLDLAIKSK